MLQTFPSSTLHIFKKGTFFITPALVFHLFDCMVCAWICIADVYLNECSWIMAFVGFNSPIQPYNVYNVDFIRCELRLAMDVYIKSKWTLKKREEKYRWKRNGGKHMRRNFPRPCIGWKMDFLFGAAHWGCAVVAVRRKISDEAKCRNWRRSCENFSFSMGEVILKPIGEQVLLVWKYRYKK